MHVGITALILWFCLLPIFGNAVDFRPDLVDHAFKGACAEFLTTDQKIGPGSEIKPRFWPWQDRALKRELRHYQKFMPTEVRLVRPANYGGDKGLLLAAELNYSEFGYVYAVLKDGTFKFLPITGKTGKSSLPLGLFIEGIAKLLLEVGSMDKVEMMVATHTHPHVNFQEIGINGAPNEFSDKDLDAANYIKYYFEANGFFFPLQFEITYSKITETHVFEDAGKIAKKALYFPKQMVTPAESVPAFDAHMQSFFASGWQTIRQASFVDRLKRILSIEPQ